MQADQAGMKGICMGILLILVRQYLSVPENAATPVQVGRQQSRDETHEKYGEGEVNEVNGEGVSNQRLLITNRDKYFTKPRRH